MRKVLLSAVIAGLTVLCTILLAPVQAGAQDIYVRSITVDPQSGQAGDTVSLQAVIGNNGPGAAYAIQVQWYLSPDAGITQDDMSLTGVETLSSYLYQGQETTIQKNITLPPFSDPLPPSYLGLILDPYQFITDNVRSNNSGAAAFTYTGTPPHSFFDPAGDNDLDIINVRAQVINADLEVAITFSEPLTGSASGLVAIDLDQSPLTGLAGISLPGVEAVADILYHPAQPYLSLRTAAGVTNLNDRLSANGNTLICRIPMSLLNNDASLDLFCAFDSSMGATTDFDRAPDVGSFVVDTATIVTRRPGDTAIHVDLDDPVTGTTEPAFPNIRRLQADVVGDQLQIVLTYNHEVDNLGAYPEKNGIFLWIGLDADRQLCTGFTNTEEHPPSLGLDYELRLMIDPLAGITGELLKDANADGEAEVVPMGLPLNDLFMRLSGDRIICRIPLGYLGFTDGSTLLSAYNLNTRDIFGSVMDRVPDVASWDLKTNAAHANQACVYTPIHLADPADDSIGAFGYDNDELIGIDVCNGSDALLFTIDYKSYALSNDGATLIYLDTDRNAATGWPITNMAGDTVLGADYVLRTYWDPDDLIQVTAVRKCIPPEQMDIRNQLTTITMNNRIYVTIPFACIGNPAGPVQAFIETASWAGGVTLLPNDDIPNHGFFTLGVCECDLNLDGRCDMRDWLLFGRNWGSTNCNAPGVICACDLNHDGRCDMRDWLLFGRNWGRTDCPGQ